MMRWALTKKGVLRALKIAEKSIHSSEWALISTQLKAKSRWFASD